jgi:hypothetical protein
MLALDVANRAGGTPKTLWSFDQGPDIPAPVTDGSLLYIVRDNGAKFALDLKTGAVVYGPERPPPRHLQRSAGARRRPHLRRR